MSLGRTMPILRMFDIAKAREFYLGFLSFKVAWEHRFAPDLPLYMAVQRDSVELHLSEHHGDATPGSAVRIAVTEIDAFHADLLSKNYGFMRPGLETQPWGLREVAVTDPFGNRLIFFEPASA
ncbi:glyoxalase superfamily protein [Tianweitania sp.]|uniref:glyoxalase superfamily protein n=1 Tax=Tianweitania sp. TaxID=2021634 RepID=UPI00289DC5D7|nr:glyoxalase superfamily protein [Tianweitania sp.]